MGPVTSVWDSLLPWEGAASARQWADRKEEVRNLPFTLVQRSGKPSTAQRRRLITPWSRPSWLLLLAR